MMSGEKLIRTIESSIYIQAVMRNNMNLLAFPHDIVSKLLTDWLPLNAVGRLDSAFYNVGDRTQFLNMISSEEFVAKQTLIVPDMPNYLSWHIKRKVKTTYVLLNKDCSLTRSCLLFATIVGRHTECIELRETKNALAVLMAGLAGGYANLQRLRLVQCGNITGLESLLQNVGLTLREISIDACTIDTDDSFKELSLPKLHSLKLANVHNCSVLVSILDRSPQLEELVLQAAQSPDNFLQQVSQHAHNLRRLTLWNCPYITDTAIANLARHCPALKDLKLGGTSLTDQAVIAFTENCLELESITLSGSFTDASLTVIATKCGAQLRCLSITGFGGAPGLNELIHNCPNLRSWSVTHLPSALPDVLVRLISSMPGLTEVALQYCTLSDDVLNAVASLGTQLLHLDITGSQGFTSAGLANVALRCTNLKTLYHAHYDYHAQRELSKGMCALWGRLNPELCFNAPNWTTPPYGKWKW